MPMPASEIEALIKAAIPDAEIELIDTAGDNDHWQAKVTSGQFRGKSRVQQHQMVNAALGDKLGRELHALSLQTFTPDD
jgi:stress-induced morphogen